MRVNQNLLNLKELGKNNIELNKWKQNEQSDIDEIDKLRQIRSSFIKNNEKTLKTNNLLEDKRNEKINSIKRLENEDKLDIVHVESNSSDNDLQTINKIRAKNSSSNKNKKKLVINDYIPSNNEHRIDIDQILKISKLVNATGKLGKKYIVELSKLEKHKNSKEIDNKGLGNIENRQKLLLDKISIINKEVKRSEEKIKILSKNPGWISEKDKEVRPVNGKSVVPKDINSSLKKNEETYSQEMNQLNEIYNIEKKEG